VALTYYAVRPLTVGGVTYGPGDVVPSASLGSSALLRIKQGLITADGAPVGSASGDNPLWDDLRVSIVRAAVSTDPPTLVNFRNTTMGFRFIQDATNSVMFDAQIPHTWDEGTEIRPHLHWSPGNSTNTGVVRWGLEYTWANATEAFPASTTLYVNAAAAGVAYSHQIAQFAPLDGTGKRVSSVFSCRLFREGANAADTFTVGAFGLSFDFHYQASGDGTVAEYPGA
jgi:hypothetical protein